MFYQPPRNPRWLYSEHPKKWIVQKCWIILNIYCRPIWAAFFMRFFKRRMRGLWKSISRRLVYGGLCARSASVNVNILWTRNIFCRFWPPKRAVGGWQVFLRVFHHILQWEAFSTNKSSICKQSKNSSFDLLKIHSGNPVEKWEGKNFFFSPVAKSVREPRCTVRDNQPSSLWAFWAHLNQVLLLIDHGDASLSRMKYKLSVNSTECTLTFGLGKPFVRWMGTPPCTLTTEQPTEEGYTGSAAMIRAHVCEIRRVEWRGRNGFGWTVKNNSNNFGQQTVFLLVGSEGIPYGISEQQVRRL